MAIRKSTIEINCTVIRFFISKIPNMASDAMARTRRKGIKGRKRSKRVRKVRKKEDDQKDSTI